MSDASAELAPYAALRRLAERELELAGEGRYNEMAQLGCQRAQIVASLPPRPPAAARDILERALALQRRVTIELFHRRERVLLSLRRVEHSKRAARGYGGALAGSPSRGVQIKA
jgi:hypothetical protein